MGTHGHKDGKTVLGFISTVLYPVQRIFKQCATVSRRTPCSPPVEMATEASQSC